MRRSQEEESPAVKELVKRYEREHAQGRSIYMDVDEFDSIAEYYLNRGRTHKMYEVVKSALKIHPQSAVLLLKRAILFVEMDEPQKALQLLERLPEMADSSIVRASALMRMNHKKEALDIMYHLVEEEENEKDIACWEAVNILTAENCFKEAMYFISLGLAFNPHNADLLYEAAFCSVQLGKIEASVHYNRLLLNEDPYDTDTWYNLGQNHLALEKYQEAMNDFDFALVTNPDHIPSVLAMAHIYFQTGRYLDAAGYYEKCYNDARDKQEENANVLMIYIAESYEKAEKYDSAISWYQKAIDTSAEGIQASAYIGMGVCHIDKGLYKESLWYLEKSLQIDANQSEPWVFIAEVYLEQGKIQDAILAYEDALRLQPEQADVYMALGNIYYDEGDYAKALAYYAEAEKRDNKLTNLYVYKALCHTRLKDLPNAESSLRMALTFDQNALDVYREYMDDES